MEESGYGLLKSIIPSLAWWDYKKPQEIPLLRTVDVLAKPQIMHHPNAHPQHYHLNQLNQLCETEDYLI
jgi:hypothetical protein